MANLFSQYTSGTQFTAGNIAGSSLGTSGINPIVDRVNSISTNNSLITGSLISGTSTDIITPYQNGNNWVGSLVSGTNTSMYSSADTNLAPVVLEIGLIKSPDSGVGYNDVVSYNFSASDLGSLDVLSVECYGINHTANGSMVFQVGWRGVNGSVFSDARGLPAVSHIFSTSHITSADLGISEVTSISENAIINGSPFSSYSFFHDSTGDLLSDAGSLAISVASNEDTDVGQIRYTMWRNKL